MERARERRIKNKDSKEHVSLSSGPSREEGPEERQQGPGVRCQEHMGGGGIGGVSLELCGPFASL